MIAHISGKIVEKFIQAVIVDVHGVGYEIQVTQGDYEQMVLHQSVKLYTYHHIREQAQDLFGFSSLTTKKLFELLISVQGVGPKAALAILSLGDSESIRGAIAQGDVTFIAHASGIGKKTAERIIIDISDKVGSPVCYVPVVTSMSTAQATACTDEALEALIALGYSLSDASKALEGVPADLSTAERVTLALKE